MNFKDATILDVSVGVSVARMILSNLIKDGCIIEDPDKTLKDYPGGGLETLSRILDQAYNKIEKIAQMVENESQTSTI